MKPIRKGIGFSRTGWEVSEFGGFSNVLLDLPYIKADYGFTIEPREELLDLPYYQSQKLFKLFLKKAKDYGLITSLLSEIKTEKKESWYNDKIKYVFSKKQVKYILSKIISNETELRSLFVHYSNSLANSEMYYERDMTKEEKENGFKDLHDDPDSLKKLTETLRDIQEQEPYNWKPSSFSGKFKAESKWKIIDKRSSRCTYNREETRDISRLVNLLDISFDVDKDKLTGLRCGKIDTSKIASIESGQTSVYYRIEEDQKTRPFSVCILADESGSMSGSWGEHYGSYYDTYHLNSYGEKVSGTRTKIRSMHSLLKVLWGAFSQIIPEDRIYVYGHTGSIAPEIRIYHDRFNPGFEEKIDNVLFNPHENNYDGPVIECIYEKIRSYTSDNILFIVISDGQPAGYGYGSKDDVINMKRVIEKCRRDGFVTVGLGFDFGGIKELYKYHSILSQPTKLSTDVSTIINSVVKSEFQ